MNLLESFQPKSNPQGEYIRFYYTKKYLQFRSKCIYESKEKKFELGRILGYNTSKSTFFSKIQKRIQTMENCTGIIPYSYLQFIGASKDELETCQEMDLKSFEEEKDKPRFPKRANQRLAPAIFRTVQIPSGFSEEEAIDYLRKDCFNLSYITIYYPELLIISLPPKPQCPMYIWQEPIFKETELGLDFGTLYSGIVQTKIG